MWSTYYTEGVPHAMDVCGSFWWRDIMQLSDIYRGVTAVHVGRGDTVLFWKDLWQKEILSETHPRAFSFAIDEDVSVRRLLTADSLSEIFALPLSPQARQEVEELQTLTGQTALRDRHSDSWTCVWGQKFTAANFYSFCFRSSQVDEAFAWIWKSNCNMKWKVFAWLLLVDRLNTRNMLRRRHFAVENNDYTCMLCPAKTEETLTHLFFHCPFATACWTILGITWPNTDERFALVHEGRRAWQRPMFMEMFTVAAWGIWKERNNNYFRGIPHSTASWRARFKTDFGLLAHRSNSRLVPFINSLVGSL